jgi:hypothetical protein
LLEAEAVEEEVATFEDEHGIEERWMVESKEYNDAQEHLSVQAYREALTSLETLVVQRLLELTKLQMSGLCKYLFHQHIDFMANDTNYEGYKQRDKISKALKTRAQAIYTALERYNRAAQCLNPPPDPLAWHDIVQMATLADFNLLRLSHVDIRTLPWTQPVARQAMSLYFGIKRAKEEIHRLNVEIRRLITYMIDEFVHWSSVVTDTRGVDPVLSSYISRQANFNVRVFQDIVYYLLKTSKLPGFSGTLDPGTSIDKPSPTVCASERNAQWLSALWTTDPSDESLKDVEVKEEAVDATTEIQNELMIDLVERFGDLD